MPKDVDRHTYAGSVLDLPRSVCLALWATAALEGRVELGRAVAAVTGDDEPHRVTGEDLPVSADPRGPGLADLFDQLSGRAVAVRAVLPVPGDARGLAGPVAATQAAVEAEEAAVTVPRDAAGAAGVLVPQVQWFGSELEPGCQVTWWSYRVDVAPSPASLPQLSDAERAMREALLEAVEALSSLDVARWRDDAADRIAMVRDGGLPGGLIPPGTDRRVVRVLSSAVRVRAIVSLATEDDGAAITGWEADRRAAGLRRVDHVARAALVAATTPPPR